MTLYLRAAVDTADSAGQSVNSAGQVVNSAGQTVSSAGQIVNSAGQVPESPPKLYLPEDDFGFLLEWLKTPWRILWAWLAAVNVLAFVVYGIDKGLSVLAGDKENAPQISEKTLFLLVLLGGGLGAMFAMQIFHHKTEKHSFSVGVPLILVLEAAAGILLFFLITGRIANQALI